MELLSDGGKGVVTGVSALYRASDMFDKSIPFKVYRVENFPGTIEHTHDYMQIWYIMSGCCEHRINKASHKLTKGNLFVLPPFVFHRIQPLTGDGVEIIGCEFLSGFINQNMPDSGEKSPLFDFAYLEPFLVSHEAVRPRLQLAGKVLTTVEDLMMDMLREYEGEEKYYELHIKANLLKLLAIIAREYEKHNDRENIELFDKYKLAVGSAIDYINKNFTREVYIEDVCRIAMMSQTYFSHLFKQLTGKTFVEYVNQLRINRAAELLVNDDSSVGEICFSVGFNDTAYFNKVFKRVTGLSPGHYRNLSSGN